MLELLVCRVVVMVMLAVEVLVELEHNLMADQDCK